jgi:hypothetical protein
VQQLRKRLTYANVMSSIAVFMVLGGASAIAATKIGTKQLKAGAVTTGKIKKNAVTASKIKKNAITTAKIRQDAVTGAKLNEATLATVPSATNATNATNATTASNLVGQTSYLFKLALGQTQLIATNGAVSLHAQCRIVGANQEARIIASTTQDGALLVGDTPHLGPGGGPPADFLNVGTPEDQRVLMSFLDTTGQISAGFEIDRGWVMGPDGKMLGLNAEGTALALNYSGAACVIGGVVLASG